MADQAPGRRRLGQTYVALAAVTWSTAGVLQRELRLDIATQVAGRALFAAFALFVVAAWQARGDGRKLWAPQPSELAMAGCMGTASGVFMVALNYASVANVLILQAAAPIAAAVISWWTLGETQSRRGVLATLLALAGVGVIAGGPSGLRPLGLLLSVLMTLGFVGAVVIARHPRDISMLPAMCLSQIAVLVVSAPFAQPATVDGHDLVLLIVLGVVQVALGLGLLTIGARILPAAEVALISLLEVVLGPVWVWLFLGERPRLPTLIGGLLVLVAAGLLAGDSGGGLQVTPRRRRRAPAGPRQRH